MRDILDSGKRKKRADLFIKISFLSYGCSVIFALIASAVTEGGLIFNILCVCFVLALAGGVLFTGLANVEGADVFLDEYQEPVSDELLQELDEMLEEARRKLAQKEALKKEEEEENSSE